MSEVKVKGPKFTPKSLWRSKRGEDQEHLVDWLKRLDSFVNRTKPKERKH